MLLEKQDENGASAWHPVFSVISILFPAITLNEEWIPFIFGFKWQLQKTTFLKWVLVIKISLPSLFLSECLEQEDILTQTGERTTILTQIVPIIPSRSNLSGSFLNYWWFPMEKINSISFSSSTYVASGHLVFPELTCSNSFQSHLISTPFTYLQKINYLLH